MRCPHHARIVCAALAAAVLLAACGGGGGGSSGTPRTVTLLDLGAGTLSTAAATFDVGTTAATNRIAFRAIGNGTYLGVFELTQAQWAALSNIQPWNDAVAAPGEGTADLFGADAVAADRPAFGLSYDQVTAALATYSSDKPFVLRLPTVDEWNAANGGALARFAWGTATDLRTAAHYAVVRETRTAVGVQPVGSRAANPRGFFDMHGNVWELVDGGTVLPDVTIKGGSWADNLASAANTTAQQVRQATPHGLVGVRVVLQLH